MTNRSRGPASEGAARPAQDAVPGPGPATDTTHGSEPGSAGQPTPREPGLDGGAAGFDPSLDPRSGRVLAHVPHSDAVTVEKTLATAAAAAGELAAADPQRRLEWVYAVADMLLEHLEELAELGDRETALGLERLRGEAIKAAESAKFYARVAAEGSFLALSTERLPDGAQLSRWNVPLGPVAVFGASNFPFGFGCVGHDAASALSAGCPVVVKAHPAHPQLSVRLAQLVRETLRDAGAPDGSYGLVVGFDAGLRLVDDPRIRAVAFTGSQQGGMALVERGARRGVPVYAEMGTVNPVFVTPGAVRDRARIAGGFVASFTQGAGQFCTKPGLLLVPSGHGFVEAVDSELAGVADSVLLTRGIAEHFREGVARLARAADRSGPEGIPDRGSGRADGGDGRPDEGSGRPDEGSGRPDEGSGRPEPASRLTGGTREPPDGKSQEDGAFRVRPRTVLVRLGDLVDGSPFLDECFGPVALVCEYDDPDEALLALARLRPSLAASVFTAEGEGDSDPDAARAIRLLLAQVGRVAVNAWPTGVATAWSQQHGGPWPATSRPDATSVGAAALQRFVRPVALQNADPARIAPAFGARAPEAPRRVDGRLR